jgi:hypothetical protein
VAFIALLLRGECAGKPAASIQAIVTAQETVIHPVSNWRISYGGLIG